MKMLVEFTFSQPIKHMNEVSLPHWNTTEEIRFDQFLRVREHSNLGIGNYRKQADSTLIQKRCGH